MASSMFTRPFTYLPALPRQGAQAPAPNLPLEDHFVSISLNDTYESLDIRRPVGDKPAVYDDWVKHSSAHRVDTDTIFTKILRSKYPNHSLVVSDDYLVDILNMDGVTWKPLDGVVLQSHVHFIPPARRTLPGRLGRSVQFGGFEVQWSGETFIVYIASWMQGVSRVTQHFILREGKDESVSLALLMACGYEAGQVGNSILIFDQGVWQKDYALWQEVQKADWKDVILSSEFKNELQSDAKNFFSGEAIYHELAVAWKRGVIFLGPPGNGKTISIKALMKSTKHPALYVKSFKSWMGEEGSMRSVFSRARREAPCLLILEDLDALINDQNRSFFLNEIDGLENNDGLFMIGSTNHFDRLDPGLSDRPSRFDRKYIFPNPNRDERVQYAQYWQRKLKSNKDITFPESLIEKIADSTEGFSFAYLKEAFVSTLVTVAANHQEGQFEKLLLKQIHKLRKELGSDGELRRV